MLSTFFFLLYTLFFLQHVLTYEEYRFKRCGTTVSFRYTPNSTISNNLNKAFKILRSNTASTNFNSTTYTINGADPVTALAVCRGDLIPSECKPCIEAATVDILQECPFHSTAVIWYNYCMIRYSETNFLTQPDLTIPPVMRIFDTRVVTDPYYDEKVLKVAQYLSVAAGKSKERFAVGWTRMTNNSTLHGYHECSRDLSSESCTNCFRNAAETIRSCCLGKWATWIGAASCQIRSNIDPICNESRVVTSEIYTDVSVSPPQKVNERSGRRDSLVIVVVVGLVIVVVFIAASLWIWLAEKKKKKISRRVSRDVKENSEEEITMNDTIGNGSFMFDFEMLAIATGNFSPSNRLGNGGFGSVYKGVGPSGKEIAVKKLAVGSSQGDEEFSNEVRLLLRIQHRNLVVLLGCCVEGEERMLVYEYMDNRSLDCIIFDKSKSAMLDWPKRFNIIEGIARGLMYLHEDSQIRIIHRDIKASNILLDEHMNPKISDFGLARLFPDELSKIRTRRIAGTIGYMAPEYAVRGILSAKCDVFSFGILILEIISGRKNYESQLEEQNQALLNLAKILEQEGRLTELVDVNIGSFPQPHVIKCIQIGLLCCQENIQVRPIMSTVALMLSNDSIAIPQPTFQGNADDTNETSAYENSVESTITMTTITGR